jgi:hypothetical protein
MAKADRLLTPQQQRFVFAILSGQNQLQAYRAAGYKGGQQAQRTDESLRKDASLVARHPRVQDALARARSELAAKMEITVDDLVLRLERAYDVALSCDPPQANAAVSATMGIGKLLGLVVDRSELTVLRNKPAPVPTQQLELDETQWRKLFDPSQKNVRNTPDDR